MIETIRPFSADELRRLGNDRARSVPRRLHSSANWREFEKRGEFPEPRDHLPAERSHQRHESRHAHARGAASPTTTWRSAASSRRISRAAFWKETAIFAIEDDPQAGWDHVSGYRTTAYCVSPYAKRGAVVSTQYNTTSILRTIEQILGLPPMNQFDASATPMFDCFTDTPDFTPFTAVPTNIALDEMNPEPKKIADPLLRRDALHPRG